MDGKKDVVLWTPVRLGCRNGALPMDLGRTLAHCIENIVRDVIPFGSCSCLGFSCASFFQRVSDYAEQSFFVFMLTSKVLRQWMFALVCVFFRDLLFCYNTVTTPFEAMVYFVVILD